MLHTVFLILKIIGIILLALLFVLLLLLVLPFAYTIKANSDGKMYNVQLSVGWLLNFLYFKLFKDNENLYYKLKILGITIYQTKKDRETKEEPAKKPKENKKNKGIKGLWEKVKNIFKNIKEVYLTLVADSTKRAFISTKRVLVHLLRHIRPRKIKGNICFGFDEPHITGQTLGYIAIAYNVLKINPKDIVIEPDFEKKIFKGNMKAKGKIALGVVLVDVLKFYLNEDIRTILNKFSKEA